MVTFGLLAVLIAVPPIAPTAPTAKSSSGREAFDTASRLFEEGAFKEALPHFEQAYRLSDRRPSAIFGLALCERALGRLDDAKLHLEEFMVVAPERQKKRARRLLAAIERRRKRDREMSVPKLPSAPEDVRPSDPSRGPPAVALSPPKSPPLDSPALQMANGVDERPASRSTSFWGRSTTWIAVGTVAVIVAGGATVGWLMTRDEDLSGGSSGIVLRP